MNHFLTPRRTVTATLLMGIWACAHGQSLGTPVAQVVLGRPLDMSMPVRFASDASDNECVQADVFYGETRLQANAVRATVSGPADQRRIRVESDTPIDEPIVTVSVRAGCRNTITRNYTLLPEYPSERLLAAIEARTAMANAAPAIPLKMAPVAAAPTSPRKAAAPHSVVVARAAAPEAPARSVRTPHRQAVVAKGPRLKLEPIDLSDTPQQDKLLRVSSTLADPAGDPSRRATAALLWQAINADPQEVLRTSAMIQKLEQDLAQLRQASNQTRAEMAALRQRLDQAQPWYLSPRFMQLLALLVVASAGAAGFLWWRTRGLRGFAEPWYVPHEEPVHAAVEPAVAKEEVVALEPEPAAPVAAEPPVVKPVPVPERAPVEAAAAPQAGPIDFEIPAGMQAAAAAKPAPARDRTDGVLRVETLAATFEEVEFLSSLGLGSDAMDILKTYLQDSASPSPLAYLELMRLCEQAEDPAAVATVRRRYAQAFGVEAPRLAQITAEGGLDAHQDLSDRITRAWGQGDALEVIEQALFRVPTPAAPITLQAGRDLLALYDLALTRATDVTPATGDAPLAPWAHAEDVHTAQQVAQEAAEAEGGSQFALDVDLTAPVEDASVSTGGPMLELEPMLPKATAEAKAAAEAAARAEAARKAQEEEDAFSAAMASERIPVSRY
jgi:hypothetical protein